MFEYLIENPMITGGGALAIFGGLVYYLKSVPDLIYRKIKKIITIEIKIRSVDYVFPFVTEYILTHECEECTLDYESRRRGLTPLWVITGERNE